MSNQVETTYIVYIEQGGEWHNTDQPLVLISDTNEPVYATYEHVEALQAHYGTSVALELDVS